MLSEASLGFLGLGVPPPAPTWGRIVGEGMMHMRTAPWAIAFGGLAIFLAVLAVSLLGEGLRDALTPGAVGRREGAEPGPEGDDTGGKRSAPMPPCDRCPRVASYLTTMLALIPNMSWVVHSY